MAAPTLPPSCSGMPPAAVAPMPRNFSRASAGAISNATVTQGHDRLTRIEREEGAWVLVHCRSHLRRRFVREVKATGSPVAETALAQIAALCRIEAEVRGAARETRLAARREKAATIVAALRPWFEAQLSKLPRRSQLATDIRLTRSPAGTG